MSILNVTHDSQTVPQSFAKAQSIVKTREGMEAVRAANSRDPEQNAWGCVQPGNLCLNTGHYREARLQFQRVGNFLPENASTYIGLAKVQTAEPRFELVRSSCRKSIAIVPTYDGYSLLLKIQA